MAKSLEKQIAEKEARRDELSAALQTIQERIEAKTQELGGDLIDKKSIDAGLLELAKLDHVEGAHNAALARLADDLQTLRAELAEQQRAQAIRDYQACENEAEGRAVALLRAALELVAMAEDFNTLAADARRISRPYDLRETDNLRFSNVAGEIASSVKHTLAMIGGSNNNASRLLAMAREGMPEEPRPEGFGFASAEIAAAQDEGRNQKQERARFNAWYHDRDPRAQAKG